jgi:glycosyltransferase involved in cell wall biosynthesis
VRNIFKPIGRAIKYGVLKRNAERSVANLPDGPPRQDLPRAAFLIGCGRSGTTVVGDVINRHPQVSYYFEPYHLWATIDPTIDVLNLYYTGAARFLLDAQHFNREAQKRFNRLILQPALEAGKPLAVEKTPFNACRIGYLDQLSPGAKYVHLIRDGVDVARSIDKLSRDQTYRIVGKPALNRWWGRSGCKWTALAEDGVEMGYFADEVHLLRSYASKGAYEWIVSLGEIDRWRERLGDRLLEMTYDYLTANPELAIKRICDFLQISVPAAWLQTSLRKIDAARHNRGDPLVLPPKMCEKFNELQERYNFPARAVPGMPWETKVQIAIISNEPTPYRVHVLNRLSRELPGVHVHNIFTHTISNPSMPWEMQIGANVNPVFFPRHHLRVHRPASFRSIPLFLAVRNYLRTKDVQMVILLGYNDLTRMLLLMWIRRRGVPILLAGDSNVFAEGRVSSLVRMIKRRYVGWVLKQVNGIMPMGTCGRAFFRLYRDHNLPEFLFPYEPDYGALRRPDPAKLKIFGEKFGLAPERKRFLYCGRLVKVKRVDVILQAFSRIATARPNWDLVIAGDGPLRKDLEKRFPPVLKNRVKWLGFLQFNQLVLSYHACDVLVHASEFEPWGLVINEAVACNLPVIATSVVGAAVELVQHQRNGLIVPPRNIEALADAMWQITAGDRYSQMRQHCPEMLDAWRKGADPVDGVVQAMRHFALIWREPGQTEPAPAEPDSSLLHGSADVVAQSAS